MTHETLGYGIIGAGYFGAELARIIQALPTARVAAVFSPEDAPALAAEVGCDVVGSVAELVARDDVDVVVIASPNDVHLEPALLAARHGKHVFCEKPVHALLRGEREPDPLLAGLTDGHAARASIATAEALTRSLAEDRKVSVSEVRDAAPPARED